ncbi:ABC transporter substrate-binding protein [Bradyrhizobium sp. HKCCYLS20291]|uniref:ABC transporter substrate-binding protein n=1 Tax=Bradyrhizobium sp. HKCCYLS20291 TaxID=3420766 RepID=UPI003EBF40A1
MKRSIAAGVTAIAAAAMLFATSARADEKPFRILVIDDLTGIYQGNGGPNTVLATTMAAEDFGGKVLGRKVEVLSVNHQNKPDIAASLAGRYIDQEGVSALVLGGSSSAGLAAQAIAKQRGITTLVTGGYASNFSGDQCSPYGTQWAPSTDALSNAVAKGLVDAGAKKWFFITADYVFGKSLSADASKAVTAAGGSVVGEAKHPLDSPDMASQILQAQSSGADIVALANAGPDLVTTIKQAREFGMGDKLAAMLVFTNNVVSMGLDVAQGMKFPVAFYWDHNDGSRAFGQRFMTRNGKQVPTMGHALAYVATQHYLKSVQKAGTDDAKVIAKTIRDLPIDNAMISNAKIQANGRVVMDLMIAEVKTPKESKDPAADLYKIRTTIPGASLFTPAEKSGCPSLLSE